MTNDMKPYAQNSKRNKENCYLTICLCCFKRRTSSAVLALINQATAKCRSIYSKEIMVIRVKN